VAAIWRKTSPPASSPRSSSPSRSAPRVIASVGKDGGYHRDVSRRLRDRAHGQPDTVTPHSEAFQAVVWHLWVSHPTFKVNQTKWESVTAKKS